MKSNVKEIQNDLKRSLFWSNKKVIIWLFFLYNFSRTSYGMFSLYNFNSHEFRCVRII